MNIILFWKYIAQVSHLFLDQIQITLYSNQTLDLYPVK